MMSAHDTVEAESTEYVTVTVGDQLFGLPIGRVQDVFVPERLTHVPLAPPEVAGMLNLRGRVVTAIDMRCRLDFGRRDASQPMLAIGIEFKGESYGLLIDTVGEVLKLPDSARERSLPTSIRVWRAWPRASTGSKTSSWSCSTSIASSTCRTARSPHDRTASEIPFG